MLQQPLPLQFVGPVHNVEQQTTIRKIVLFVATLHQQLPTDRDLPLVHSSPVDSSTSQEDSSTTDLLPVMPSTAQSATVQIAHSLITVTSVVPTTVPCTAQAKAVLFNKSKPWTPTRPFILERKLSNHPNKTFVEELIHDLCYGCTIGYTGPQFSYLANNLLSANQQPEVIDATLEKECEVGRVLGPFESPPHYQISELLVWA